MTRKNITLSRSPSFGGLGSNMAFAIVFISFFTALYLFFTEDPFSTFGPLVLTAISFPFFLSIKGYEYNPTNQTLRAFKEYFWIRTGQWVPVNWFSEIELTRDMQYTSGNVAGYANVAWSPGSYHFHYILLKYKDGNIASLLINEFLEYQDAKKFLEFASATLNLPVIDKPAERLKNSRLKRGRRR